MRLLTIFFVCVILFQINVFAELSSSSCALLRTASSFTAIIPELTQLAMRYYRASLSFSTEHSRQKRFLFNENTAKDSSSGNIKGSVVEQMIANAVRDVNFTNVAILILSNNETMNKIRKHVDSDAMIRLIMREINYEKLANGFWSVAGTEFDLEHFTASIINKTNIDIIHNELLTNGTLPEWLLKSIHPELNVIAVQRVFSTLKNVTEKFVEILSKSERFDNYLFNMITQQTLTPLNNILEGIKEKKPKNFTQLVGIIVDNLNRVATEQFSTNTKGATTKKPGKNLATTTVPTVDLNDSDDVKLMLYQWSIAVDSMGQTARVILKSLEQFYCASVWE